MTEKEDLSSRLKTLDDDFEGSKIKRTNTSPLLALGIFAVAMLIGGGVYYALTQEQAGTAFQTQSTQDFQTGGAAFGDLEMARRDPLPVTTGPVPATEPEPQPNSEMTALLEQLAAMQAELAALRAAPADTGSEELSDLQRQMAAIQAAADQAQRDAEAAARRLDRELADRNREITRLQSDLQMARLAPPPGPVDESRDREREELERRRAAAEAERLARLNSPMIAIGGRGGAGGGDDALEERRLDSNEEFVRGGARPAPVEQARVIVNPANTITQGTMVQASLETAIDSSLPGPIRAVVTQDVHSYDGSRILIPRGSRLIGRYSANVSIGQYRAMVAWERIILPDDQTVTISAFGGDQMGRSGVSGRVNKRFGERFGSAALISLLSSGPTLVAREIESEATREAATRVADDLRDATGNVVSDYLSLPPIITVNQGARVTVMVDRDLEIF